MKPALEYLLSILMTYLPPRYRAQAAKLRGPTMIAGILQCGLAMGYLLYRFYIFSWERAGLIGSGVNTHKSEIQALRRRGLARRGHPRHRQTTVRSENLQL